MFTNELYFFFLFNCCTVSSGSDSGEESEESDGSRDVANRCQHCFTTSKSSVLTLPPVGLQFVEYHSRYAAIF